MLSFTKKFAIAMLVVCSTQLDAFGSYNNNDLVEEPGKQLVAANPVAKRQLGDEVTGKDSRFLTGLPKVVMKLIFLEASKVGADPCKLMAVNPHWARSMRYDIPINSGAATADLAGIPYTNPGPANFIVDCMRRYMEGIVARGVLYYKKGEAGKERTIGFSADGIAILADCEGQDQYQVYTLSEDRLRLVRGANENKLVTFFGPFHKARHLLPADAKGTESDVVVIWKWGNDMLRNARGTFLFDYLIIKPVLLGVTNMLENWEKSECAPHGRAGVCGCGYFHACL